MKEEYLEGDSEIKFIKKIDDEHFYTGDSMGFYRVYRIDDLSLL